MRLGLKSAFEHVHNFQLKTSNQNVDICCLLLIHCVLKCIISRLMYCLYYCDMIVHCNELLHWNNCYWKGNCRGNWIIMSRYWNKIKNLQEYFPLTVFSSNSSAGDNLEPQEMKLCAGDMCLAQCAQDGYWYRSEVTGVTSDNITVLFVDNGKTDTMPSAKVRIWDGRK